MSRQPIPDIDFDLSDHRILITNDDGVNAPGLERLEAIARTLSDDVWVVAPEFEQSGAGHSLTLTLPLRLRQISERRFAVQGTPTDSVMLAVKKAVSGKRPTLLLSGVNRGANLGEDTTYSGTVAAAMEGALLGIPSIALSQALHPDLEGYDFSAAEDHAERVIRWLMSVGWHRDALMNVNFPDARCIDINGLEITAQGRRDLGDISIDERHDTRGQPYYWIGLRKAGEHLDEGTDIKSVREGYISVTPLHMDLTHFETRDALLKALKSG